MDRAHANCQDPSPSASPSPRGPTLRRVLAWLLLVAAAAMFCYRGPWRAMRSGTDFALYYCSSVAWAEGSNPYAPGNLRDIAARSGGAPAALLDNAVSPPVTYVLLSPLALLPWRQAQGAWLGLNLLLTAGMLWSLLRLADVRPGSARGVLLLALILGLAPLHTGLKHGQMALACTALLVGAIHARQVGREGAAGMLLAAAGLLKPQIVLFFGLYWLCRKRWRAVLTAGAVAGIVTAVAFLRLHLAGVPWWPQWQENISRCFHGGYCDYAAPDHAHIFINLQHPLYAIFGSREAATWIGWALTAALASAGLAAWWRTSDGPRHELSILAFLAVVCLLPVYHVFYDAVTLVLVLCWAVSVWNTPLRPHALAAILLTLPFMVSGAAALHVLAETGRVPAGWAGTWWWRTLLLPHQPYLLTAIGAVLVSALFRAARPASAGASGSPRNPGSRG